MLGYRLVWFGLLAVVVVDAADSEICHQRDGDVCKCVYDDGFGYDLADLGSSKNVLETQCRDDNNLTFFYHPCKDMDIPHSDKTCKSSSLCVFNNTDNSFASLGIAKDAKFSEADGYIFIVFKNPLNNGTTVMVQLGCSNLPVDHLVKSQSNDANDQGTDKIQYNLVLYSKHACKLQLEEVKSMSTGSMLVVSFFTVVLVYLVLGMSFNHFLVGARGLEVVPNLSFWRDFPALVKDGISFVQNGCSPIPTTELLTPNTPNPDSYVSI